MRGHLLDPTDGDPRLDEAIALGHDIYNLYEAGQDYSASLKRLGLIAGHPIHGFAVHDAFGSVKPEIFARRQLVAWDRLPTDITHQEMLEMIERISTAKGDQLQIQYWLVCLAASTGDDKISDLLFWPGSYFGDANDATSMSPVEILATALKSGEKRKMS